jgi:cation:H+ antiporter
MSPTSIVVLVAGLVALVAGAEALVRGAAALAARTGMSPVVIGLTVVAFGTSAPELAVSVGDVLRGGDQAGEIAVGNVVGSNIANIGLVLGLAATVGGGLYVAQRIVRLDVPLMIGASVALLLFALDERIGRLEGSILFATLLGYVVWTVRSARRAATDDGGATDPAQAGVDAEYDDAIDPERLTESPVFVDIGWLVGGLVLLVAGAQALVSSASDIATDLGVSDLVIGLTVVAIGTSLPEVATSLLAALRGQRDIAVGNAIGSNLFNIFAVLGLTAIVAPRSLPIAPSSVQVDIPVMIAFAVACLPIFANGYELRRWEGVVFVVVYASYVGWLVLDATEHSLRDSYGSAMLYFVVPLVAMTIVVLWWRGRHVVQRAG